MIEQFLQQISQMDISTLSWQVTALVITLILWRTGFIKSVIGLMDAYRNKLNYSLNGDSIHEDRLTGHDAQLHKIETNDLSHIEADIKDIRGQVSAFSVELNKQGNRITVLETLMKK